MGPRSDMSTLQPDSDLASEEPEFKPLTAQQARELREKNPPLSPWRVIVGQILAGALVALLAWVLTGRPSVAWSVAWGALAVVVPAALFARGLASPVAQIHAGAAAFAFFLWEAIKLALTVAMLFAAPRLVVGLSWPAMLVGLVLTMKVYWLALVFKKTFSARLQTNKS